MWLKRLFRFIFRSRNPHRSNSSSSNDHAHERRAKLLHGAAFWKHQLELVVEEKNYYRTLYQTVTREMAKLHELPSRPLLDVDKESSASTSAPTTRITRHRPGTEEPSYQPLNTALQDKATPSAFRERSTQGIKTDFIPAAMAMASMNLLPPDPPSLPGGPPSEEKQCRQDLKNLSGARSGLCCDCSGCESEREMARETANALLNLSSKTSKLHQEIYQLKLESFMKDQLIFMLRQEEPSPEEIDIFPPVPFITVPRSHMSLPTSPRRTFYS